MLRKQNKENQQSKIFKRIHEGYKYNEMKNIKNSEYVDWKQLYNTKYNITLVKIH